MPLSKTQRLFLEHFDKSKLTKIRLKIDPLNYKLKNFYKLNGYEGYILNENILDKTLDILLLGDMDDPIIRNIPSDCVDQNSVLSKLEKFKIAAKTYLIQVIEIAEDDDMEVIQDIENASSINDIERCLKDYGLSNEKICEVYKLYVLSNDVIN